MKYVLVAGEDLQREFHLARSHPRHLAPQPKAPIISPRAGLERVVDSLLFAQHAIEMFRRSLPDGFPEEAIGRAKAVCQERLKNLEENFQPAGFDPACLLAAPAKGSFGISLADAALAELEAEGWRLPDSVHAIFRENWFSYACHSFRSELGEDTSVATVYGLMRQETGFANLELTVRREGKRTRKAVSDAKNEIIEEIRRSQPVARRDYDTADYFRALRIETRLIELHELKLERDETPEPAMDALYIPLMSTTRAEQQCGAKKQRGKAIQSLGQPEAINLEKALEDRRLIIEGDPGSGKTTFLRRIAWALCREDKEERLELPFKAFPMFVRIRDLDEHIHKTLEPSRGKPGDPVLPHDHAWIAHFLASVRLQSGCNLFRREASGP